MEFTDDHNRPHGYYDDNNEYSRPFIVFGDTFTTDGLINGKKLPYLGTYTLTALPDGLITKKKGLTFNVVPDAVDAVQLWDTTTKTVMKPNFTGGNIWNSKTVNFEAVMPLADSSKITLIGTNGFSASNTEQTPPFSIFNDSGGVFNGRKLSTGNYTLTIFPNEAVTNNVKVIPFAVVSC